jgi:hypothetical protein
MNLETAPLPPLAQALGRLRQPRAWPYAPRPAGTEPPPTATTPPPDHDLLRILPEPALTGELPPAAPRPGPPARLTALEAIALAPVNRTYWFDL